MRVKGGVKEARQYPGSSLAPTSRRSSGSGPRVSARWAVREQTTMLQEPQGQAPSDTCMSRMRACAANHGLTLGRSTATGLPFWWQMVTTRQGQSGCCGISEVQNAGCYAKAASKNIQSALWKIITQCVKETGLSKPGPRTKLVRALGQLLGGTHGIAAVELNLPVSRQRLVHAKPM